VAQESPISQQLSWPRTPRAIPVRSTPAGETPEDLRLMRLIDEQFTACPFYRTPAVVYVMSVPNDLKAIPASGPGIIWMRAAAAIIPNRAISHRAPSLGRISRSIRMRLDDEPVNVGRDPHPFGHRAG
jgi:hypothetical protein